MAPSPPSQIDYRGFPHIVDLILSFSTPKVVRTFRLTSRHYEELITTRHLKHLVLSSDGCLGSEGGHLVAYRRCGLSLNNCKPTATERHRLVSLLRKAKTLTMHIPPSGWLVSLLPYLDAVYNCAHWMTATIPASRIAIWRTKNSNGMHLLQPGIRTIIIDSVSMPSIMAKDEGTPLKVDEIVHFFRLVGSLTMSTLLTAFGIGVVLQRHPPIDCNRVTIVGAPDEVAFMKAIHSIGGGDRYRDLNEIKWLFLSREEYVQTLSAEDKALIIL